MSAATVSNVRPDKTRKSALSPAALVAFKLVPAPIKTERASLRDVQMLAGHKALSTTQRYIEGDVETQKNGCRSRLRLYKCL
jgi:hypothetical protein